MVITRRSLLVAGAAIPASAYGQCVINAPAVDACRGGVRNAGPAGATLDLNFMFPGSLDPRITFSRASTATYTDASGVIQSAAVNQPRWDYAGGVLRGLLIEEARTNLLLNSATLSTQSVTTTAASHTLSFYGTGTVTKSGTATGALVGTGAAQRVTQTFTPTAGSLTLTVTGTVTNAQIEAGSFATSWISTAGTSVTRATDQCAIPPAGMSGWFVPPGGTWFAEFIYFNPSPNNSRIISRKDLSADITPLFLTPPGVNASQYDGVGAVQTTNAITVNTIAKAVSSWASGQAKVCNNGGPVATSATMTGSYAPLGTDGISFMTPAVAGSVNNAPGCLRRVQYWPRVLSNAEMQQVTA